MYVCRECEQPLNQATEVCPYCGTDLTAPAPEESAARPKKKSWAKSLLFWGVLIACVWAVVWFVLPPRAETSRPEAEKSVLAALGDVRAALAAYSAATGNFPATLEPLGATARTAAQWAQNAGYELEYAPSPPAADGRVRTYTLLARPSNYGYRQFYTDETGVIHATRENRPATAQDPEFR